MDDFAFEGLVGRKVRVSLMESCCGDFTEQGIIKTIDHDRKVIVLQRGRFRTFGLDFGTRREVIVDCSKVATVEGLT